MTLTTIYCLITCINIVILIHRHC
uniref:Uncharacterized protein At3g60380 n=1 Tax=Arabidopsis thaliana TaxID=3702 RepID=Q8VY83_ARATH|nr:putative protein [Arabidopsis thaliana]AAO30090.1 putative protein [Arabidopsis thaliana]